MVRAQIALPVSGVGGPIFDPEGFLVAIFWKDGPAEKLGIQPGDVLVQFAFHPIASVADFQKWLYMYGVGQAVKLTFVRGESAVVVDYVIEERPSWARPQ